MKEYLKIKFDTRFLKHIAIALVTTAGLAAYPLIRYGSAEVILATVIGAIISTINVLLGYLSIEYSLDKSYSTFLKAVLGGMGVRMLFMLAALLIFIKLFGFHAVALTVSLLGFYVIYLTLEVIFVQKKLVVKNHG
jgi:hypothetical protein